MASNGNFCTWYSEFYQGGSSSTTTFSFGNCRVGTTSGGYPRQLSNFAFPSSGKWYIELNNIVNNGYHVFGIVRQSNMEYGDGLFDGTGQYQYQAWNGQKRGNGGSAASYGSSWGSVGDVIGMAFDADNGKIWWAKNGTWQGSGDPAGNSNEAFSGIDASENYYFGWSDYYTANPGTVHINCGQDSSFGNSKTSGSANAADDNGFGDFYYTPPTGFLALSTANLPIADEIDPAQTDDDYIGGKQFEAIKYTGNDGTNNITYGFKPDMVIHKMLGSTGGGYPAQLWDTSRGDDYYLYPSNTNQSAISGSDYLEFTSTGVKLDNSWDGLNHNGESYISFGWRANGGTTSTNTQGDTNSTVQANQDGGFSIVEYAGTLTSSGTKTIGHGLSKAPEFIIIKNPNKTGRWFVQHIGLTNWNYYLSTNTLSGETNSSGNGSMSAPTSTVFYTNWTEGSNESPYNHIAYCWHSVEGLSKFGTYSGAGNTDGTFIYTGFRPKCVWIKRKNTSSVTYGWPIFIDEINNNVNDANFKNFWLDQYVGASDNYPLDFLSNGFKHRNSNANLDGSGSTYIYCAWGSVPFKYNNTF